MELVHLSLVIWLVAGMISLLCGVGRQNRWAHWVGGSGAAVGCVIALISAAGVLLSGQPRQVADEAWSLPGWVWHLELDSLSAWFVVPVFFCGFCQMLALGSLVPGQPRWMDRAGWLWWNVCALLGGMLVVLTAHNVAVWLFAWEVMSLALYLLMTLDVRDAAAARAGWSYLVATHLATAAILPVALLCSGAKESAPQPATAEIVNVPDAPDAPDQSVLVAQNGGVWGGAAWTLQPLPASWAGSAAASALFIAAVCGFGAKAGLMPFHVWMAESYAVTPSFVSALSSGMMGKVAIYGLMRFLLQLGPFPWWWSVALIVVGTVSAAGGLLFALPQRELRRTLAYSSTENIGIIYLGLGVAWFGMSVQSPAAAMLGFAGALVHVWSHAAAKSLALLSVARVESVCGSQRLDALGGCLKKLPGTAAAFAVGAMALAAVPPCSGFVSEFLILLAALEQQVLSSHASATVELGVIAILAFVSGLAVMCMTQVFGMVFLGAPRQPVGIERPRPAVLLTVASMLLAGACLGIAVFAPQLIGSMNPVLTLIGNSSPEQIAAAVSQVMRPLRSIQSVFLGLMGMVTGLTLLRMWLLKDRLVTASETWDCGYAAPSARMQYTAASFQQSVAEFLPALVPLQTTVRRPEGLFPTSAQVDIKTDDPVLHRFWQPIFSTIERGLRALSFLQHGLTNGYVLYIAVTILILLWWTSRQMS
jgi:hydrogenase-4 component B